MRINLSGLSGPGVDITPTSIPNSATCGPNPCSWVDDIYLRDSCLSFMKCATPNANPVVIDAASQIAADMTLADVAQDLGTAGGGATAYGFDILGRFLGGAAGGVTGGVSLYGLLFIGVAMVVAVSVLPAVLNRR